VNFKTFQRQRGSAAQIHPGQYIRCYDMGGGLATLAILRCPGCSHAFSINKHDDNPIDSDGVPAKPVMCKHCHEFFNVHLMDWSKAP